MDFMFNMGPQNDGVLVIKVEDSWSADNRLSELLRCCVDDVAGWSHRRINLEKNPKHEWRPIS